MVVCYTTSDNWNWKNIESFIDETATFVSEPWKLLSNLSWNLNFSNGYYQLSVLHQVEIINLFSPTHADEQRGVEVGFIIINRFPS